MEIYLNPNTKSLTGILDKNHGYYLRTPWKSSGKLMSFAQRMPSAPPDGHWRCICDCAALAQQGLIITDIRVSGFELAEALSEAGMRRVVFMSIMMTCFYDAKDVLKFKRLCNL